LENQSGGKGNQVPIEDRTIVQDLKETTLDKEIVTPNVQSHKNKVLELDVLLQT
jgi:hypothetical protein